MNCIHVIRFSIVTARKRSLRRLCFYRCLSVHRGWFSIRGVSPSGGVLHPGGGVVLHPDGGVVLHPGGFSIRGVLHLGGFSIWGGSPSGRGVLHPGGVLHPVNVRAVRILLECILVPTYLLVNIIFVHYRGSVLFG